MSNTPGFLSLVQGQKYQSKKSYTNKKSKNFKQVKEGFATSDPNIDITPRKPVLINEYTRMKTTNLQNQKDLDELQKMQAQYNDLLTKYKNLTNQIKTDTQNNMDKVSLSNPYLEKNITLSNVKGALPIIGSGSGGYVTSQGNFKNYPDSDTMNATIGKNGCPTDFVKNVQLDKYSKLLSQGSDMISGQSCGNENSNVYVTNLNSSPVASYIGCYNNSPDTLTTNIVPIMNSTNSVNGFVSSASSVYQNNNTTFGPWAAFDQDINTFWHSNVVYNNSQYTGTNTMSVITSDGSTTTISGESLTITLPSVFTLTSYDIQGRQDCCGNSPMTANGRNPNTWYIVGFNSSNNTWKQVDYQQTTNYNISKLTFKIANPQPYSAYAIIIVTVGDNSAPVDQKTCVQISSWNLYTNNNTNSAETNGMIDSGLGATTIENCQNYALDNGYQYYGMQKLQNGSTGSTANCMVSNDKTQIIAYGQPEKQLNMVPLWASNTSGTDYKTAILLASGQISLSNSSGKTMIVNTPASSGSTGSRLMLFPDGNMYIFASKGLVSNTIFSSGTSGKQQNKNSNWIASKGKYGKSYLNSGQGLNANEWIGSDDGSLQLIMQTDGNLVLYTSTTIEGCVLDKSTNKMFGNDNINAVYQINNVGYPENMGNVGYVDGDTILHQYPSSMLSYSDQYKVYDNYNSTGNDLSQVQVNDINACKQQCNSYNDNKCAGFVFEKGSNICYLKDANTYPKSPRLYNSGFSLGVRTPTILNTNTNTKLVEIDSIQYQNYPKGNNMTPGTNFNSSVISENVKNQMTQIQNQLTSVASHIANKMEEMYNQDKSVVNKMNMNDIQFKKQILMYKTVSMNENELREGFQNVTINDINGLVKDSDLHVLQENYGYIFWSILAVGLLSVTFNVIRRE